jgi:hypothetical protein
MFQTRRCRDALPFSQAAPVLVRQEAHDREAVDQEVRGQGRAEQAEEAQPMKGLVAGTVTLVALVVGLGLEVLVLGFAVYIFWALCQMGAGMGGR